VYYGRQKYYIESRRKNYPTCNKKKGKANWNGHILCSNCLLKHVSEGDRRTEVTGRGGGGGGGGGGERGERGGGGGGESGCRMIRKREETGN
jgi:hypothetical protein